jgi:DHA3 family macrolide efflux protein-like MFS transporter
MATRTRSPVRRLALARLISLTGGAAAYLALNFVIYEKTGSATWVAVALILTFGALGLASPFAGALGDKFDRRMVMIVSDLAGAAVFLAMAFVEDPGVLVALAFLAALAEAPFLAASTAAIPNLVDEDQIGYANGLIALGRNAGIVLGPVLGGVLVASVGGGAVFASNAVSFVLSALLVASVRGRFAGDRTGGEEHRGLRAGFRFLFSDRILRTMALTWLGLVLALGMTMVADVALAEVFEVGSLGYGLLIACWGGGSIVGALMGRYLSARTEALAFVAGTAVVAVTCLGVGVSPWFSLVLVIILVMGVGDGLTLVAQQGIMQRRTPDAVRSRVSGAFDAVVHTGLVPSYAVAGPAVAVLGARGVYVAGGLAAILALVIALPIVKEGRRPTGTGQPEEQPAEAQVLLP